MEDGGRPADPVAGAPRVYVGHGNPDGDISWFQMDPRTAALAPAGGVAIGASSSFLAVDPSRRSLYATQNRSDQLAAFALNAASGRPELLGRVPVPHGPDAQEAGPSYLRVDATGAFVLCANYRGHNAVVFPRRPGGSLGPAVQNVSAGRHAHAAVLSPDNRFAFVPHLGSDLVAQYRFDAATGALTRNDPPSVLTPAGSGPRHLVFHPDGARAYLIDELDGSVIAFTFDPRRGTLEVRQRLESLPAGYQGRRWAADIQVHPSGRFLYASNRAHEGLPGAAVPGEGSLAVFRIDPASGQLTLDGYCGSRGRTPRNFCLDRAGRFLLVANQDSANLVTFAVDADSGRLTPIAERDVAPSPTFVDIVLPP
jgi:6-phosphogluconolactonase